MSERPIRVLRIIARLNIGGPAVQAITLTKRLDPARYETTLLRGREGPREGSMDHLAEDLGVRPLLLPTLQRSLGLHDLRAIWSVRKIIRRWRPDVLHTHTAKAGTVGRIAALLAFGARPGVIVHTFHGHVLTGYFSPAAARLFTYVERVLARVATCLVAVSPEVRDDLVKLGIAPIERVEVIPLGFDLKQFAFSEPERAERRRTFRTRHGIPADAEVVTLIARLVPIKRVDRFLRIARQLVDRPTTWFLVIGDGELYDILAAEVRDKGPERLVWAGFELDIPTVLCATDVAVLTSDNEGTPVSLIEAQAARVPVVTTDVGGARAVVEDGVTGWVVAAASEAQFATAIRELLDNPGTATRFGSAGAIRARRRFDEARLLGDVDRLYQRLLAGN